MADFKIQSSIQIDTAYIEEQLNAVRQRFEEFRARLTQPIPIRLESVPLPNAPRTDETATRMPRFIPDLSTLPAAPASTAQPPAPSPSRPPAPNLTAPRVGAQTPSADAASSAAQSTSQLGDAANRGTSRFKALLSSVSSMAGGLLNCGISWGTAFMKGIASGMKTGWSVVKTAGGILVKGIAGIFSIGSLAASWGIGIARGIANGLRGGISSITGVARSIISGVTGVIRSGISAAGSIARALDPASQMQQYGITMDVLLKDPGKAKERLAELKKFAGETNFDIREVVESSNLMQAFGIHGDGIARLKLAGDAANAFGKDIREVVTSLNYLGSGRGGEAFESLARIGVTRDKLKPYGVEFNAQGSLITPTKKALDAVFKYFEKEYGGMTARMGKTWAGALKIAGSEWFNALADGFSKALAPLTSFVNDSITPLIRSLGSFLKTQDLGGMLKKPLELATGFTTHIRRFLDPATHTQGVSEFKNLGAAIMESGQRLLTAFGFIGTGLVQSLGKIMENFFGNGGMRTVVEALVSGLATIGNFFLDTFKVILDSFSDRFKSNLLVAIEKILPMGENEETNKRAKAEATARKEVIEEFATKIQEGKIKLPEDIDQQAVDKKIQEKAQAAKLEFLSKHEVDVTEPSLSERNNAGALSGADYGVTDMADIGGMQYNAVAKKTVKLSMLDDKTLEAKYPEMFKAANEAYQKALDEGNSNRNKVVAEMLLDRNNGEIKAEFDRRVAVGMGWQDADSHRTAGYNRTMESAKKLWGDIGKAISVNMQGASEPLVRSLKYAGKLGIGEPIVNELQGEAKFHQFSKARDSWNAYYDRQKTVARSQIDRQMQAETHLSKKERKSLRQTRYDRADELIEQQRNRRMAWITTQERRYSSQLTEYRQTQRERRAAETRSIVEEFNRGDTPAPSGTGRGIGASIPQYLRTPDKTSLASRFWAQNKQPASNLIAPSFGAQNKVEQWRQEDLTKSGIGVEVNTPKDPETARSRQVLEKILDFLRLPKLTSSSGYEDYEDYEEEESAPAQKPAALRPALPQPFAIGPEPDRNGDPQKWRTWYQAGGWRKYANTYAKDENGHVYGYTDRNGVFGYGELDENGEFQAHDALNSRRFKPPWRKQTSREIIEELEFDIGRYTKMRDAIPEDTEDKQALKRRQWLDEQIAITNEELEVLRRNAEEKPKQGFYIDENGQAFHADANGRRTEYRRSEDGTYAPVQGPGFIYDQAGKAVGRQDSQGRRRMSRQDAPASPLSEFEGWSKKELFQTIQLLERQAAEIPEDASGVEGKRRAYIQERIKKIRNKLGIVQPPENNLTAPHSGARNGAPQPPTVPGTPAAAKTPDAAKDKTGEIATNTHKTVTGIEILGGKFDTLAGQIAALNKQLSAVLAIPEQTA